MNQYNIQPYIYNSSYYSYYHSPYAIALYRQKSASKSELKVQPGLFGAMWNSKTSLCRL